MALGFSECLSPVYTRQGQRLRGFHLLCLPSLLAQKETRPILVKSKSQLLLRIRLRPCLQLLVKLQRRLHLAFRQSAMV